MAARGDYRLIIANSTHITHVKMELFISGSSLVVIIANSTLVIIAHSRDSHLTFKTLGLHQPYGSPSASDR